jgi:uncharacterized DUF497 family protein
LRKVVFEWDSANVNHIARHGVTPEEAEQAINNEPFDLGGEIRNGEYRTAHLGATDLDRILVVYVTERDQMVRVVTALDANRELRRHYEYLKKARDG